MAQVPNTFLDSLWSQCQAKPGRLAMPESLDPRILAAAHELLERGAVRKLYLWRQNDHTKMPSSLAVLREKFPHSLEFLDVEDPHLISLTAAQLQTWAAAKAKTWRAEDLASTARQALDQAGALLASDAIDGVVAGCVTTTADVIRSALRTVGLAPHCKTLSGSFAMVRTQANEHTLHYLFADCGVVIDPTAEQLLDIAVESVNTFRSLFPWQAPHVAFLSFSTHGSAEHPNSQKMRQAYEMFRQRMPDVVSDGELQFDAAIDATVAQHKAPHSALRGHANCFLFPSLDAGNIAYKVCQRLAGFDAYGPILQGCAKPFMDLSRGASAADITTAALIALLRARSTL